MPESDGDGASAPPGDITSHRRRAGQRLVETHADGARIPESARSEFWTLSRRVAGRHEDEEHIIDAIASLVHLSLAGGFDPNLIILAAMMHAEHETGRRIRTRPDGEARGELDSLGQSLVLLCLSNGRVWSREDGWVADLLQAKLYDIEAARKTKIDREDCLFASFTQVRNLIEIDRIPVRLPDPGK